MIEFCQHRNVAGFCIECMNIIAWKKIDNDLLFYGTSIFTRHIKSGLITRLNPLTYNTNNNENPQKN